MKSTDYVPNRPKRNEKRIDSGAFVAWLMGALIIAVGLTLASIDDGKAQPQPAAELGPATQVERVPVNTVIVHGVTAEDSFCVTDYDPVSDTITIVTTHCDAVR